MNSGPHVMTGEREKKIQDNTHMIQDRERKRKRERE